MSYAFVPHCFYLAGSALRGLRDFSPAAFPMHVESSALWHQRPAREASNSEYV
ncbi:MAG: hypothetical protein ACXVCX_07700 [Ktedonobacterales bacterium]